MLSNTISLVKLDLFLITSYSLNVFCVLPQLYLLVIALCLSRCYTRRRRRIYPFAEPDSELYRTAGKPVMPRKYCRFAGFGWS